MTAVPLGRSTAGLTTVRVGSLTLAVWVASFFSGPMARAPGTPSGHSGRTDGVWAKAAALIDISRTRTGFRAVFFIGRQQVRSVADDRKNIVHGSAEPCRGGMRQRSGTGRTAARRRRAGRLGTADDARGAAAGCRDHETGRRAGRGRQAGGLLRHDGKFS